ncbi:unnamed protein product [Amoebophrya sp. A25]|nr:unnamed protein product [Amoebophrya sp. A25]|eukprot:GSA25T00008727001.1
MVNTRSPSTTSDSSSSSEDSYHPLTGVGDLGAGGSKSTTSSSTEGATRHDVGGRLLPLGGEKVTDISPPLGTTAPPGISPMRVPTSPRPGALLSPRQESMGGRLAANMAANMEPPGLLSVGSTPFVAVQHDLQVVGHDHHDQLLEGTRTMSSSMSSQELGRELEPGEEHHHHQLRRGGLQLRREDFETLQTELLRYKHENAELSKQLAKVPDFLTAPLGTRMNNPAIVGGGPPSRSAPPALVLHTRRPLEQTTATRTATANKNGYGMPSPMSGPPVVLVSTSAREKQLEKEVRELKEQLATMQEVYQAGLESQENEAITMARSFIGGGPGGGPGAEQGGSRGDVQASPAAPPPPPVAPPPVVHKNVETQTDELPTEFLPAPTSSSNHAPASSSTSAGLLEATSRTQEHQEPVGQEHSSTSTSSRPQEPTATASSSTTASSPTTMQEQGERKQLCLEKANKVAMAEKEKELLDLRRILEEKEGETKNSQIRIADLEAKLKRSGEVVDMQTRQLRRLSARVAEHEATYTRAKRRGSADGANEMSKTPGGQTDQNQQLHGTPVKGVPSSTGNVTISSKRLEQLETDAKAAQETFQLRCVLNELQAEREKKLKKQVAGMKEKKQAPKDEDISTLNKETSKHRSTSTSSSSSSIQGSGSGAVDGEASDLQWERERLPMVREDFLAKTNSAVFEQLERVEKQYLLQLSKNSHGQLHTTTAGSPRSVVDVGVSVDATELALPEDGALTNQQKNPSSTSSASSSPSANKEGPALEQELIRLRREVEESAVARDRQQARDAQTIADLKRMLVASKVESRSTMSSGRPAPPPSAASQPCTMSSGPAPPSVAATGDNSQIISIDLASLNDDTSSSGGNEQLLLGSELSIGDGQLHQQNEPQQLVHNNTPLFFATTFSSTSSTAATNSALPAPPGAWFRRRVASAFSQVAGTSQVGGASSSSNRVQVETSGTSSSSNRVQVEELQLKNGDLQQELLELRRELGGMTEDNLRLRDHIQILADEVRKKT